MNAALCDFSICGVLEKQLLTYLLTYEILQHLPSCVAGLFVYVLRRNNAQHSKIVRLC